jgi:hypothetical protein
MIINKKNIKLQTMKKSKYLRLFVAFSLILLISCQNQPWSFPDYEYTTTYFPFQSPLRTLILGDYNVSDNTNDNNLKFNIGVRVGGMYDNTKDWSVNYELDPNLVKKLFNVTNDTMKILPSTYYSLSPAATITVPKGSFVGNVEVQLSESFLDDPLSYKGVYVIPLRITGSTTDSILMGKVKSTVSIDTADMRIPTQWDIAPIHYTLYGIKFINAYHGVYLRRGMDSIRDNTTGALKLPVVKYHQADVVQDELCYMKTVGRNKVEVTGSSRAAPLSVKMLFDFASDGTCTIVQSPGAAYTVTGTGVFVKDGDAWGNKSRNVIRTSYQVVDLAKNEKHYVKDTIVVRDRDVKFETFSIVVKK